jgi:hypothetical protein
MIGNDNAGDVLGGRRLSPSPPSKQNKTRKEEIDTGRKNTTFGRGVGLRLDVFREMGNLRNKNEGKLERVGIKRLRNKDLK